ncbi:hypothetical protein PFY01_09270 [Brevundimonas vesicularis]|uniref:hypothetical protein n=1 Tax=Brevundimonas vesicularis TaxID=41276 RepID=UPI0022EC532C|nr:hypothetical protein [Brevundimonas vesicularis]WBT04844.1 hypothetical protein PFY01_08825 [Brevundimonas vesicularis]WBT04931.1 hypothetical protein PFY01_09270 [Brevundimonas vesicularis]
MIGLLAAFAVQTDVDPSQVGVYARVDTVSQYVAVGATCPQLGYVVADDFTDVLVTRIVDEASAGGVDEATINRWSGDIVGRQTTLFRQGLSRDLDALESGGEPQRIVDAMFDRHEALCAKAAADPITVGIFTAEPPDVRAAARQAASDELLKGYGKASWQTSKVFATGELLLALGMCKSQISPARHDDLLARHLPTPAASDPASKWLSTQYVDGLQGAPEMALDETQCARLLRSRTAAAS